MYVMVYLHLCGYCVLLQYLMSPLVALGSFCNSFSRECPGTFVARDVAQMCIGHLK